MSERQSLLECMLQEASDIQRVELSHDEVKALLAKTPEFEFDLEKYGEITVKEFFSLILQEMESKKVPVVKETKNDFEAKRSMVFGALPDSTVKVDFDENNVKMGIYITQPKIRGKKIPHEMISSILEECGVTYGIKEAYVKRLSRAPVYNTHFIIAEGIPAVAGEDGKVEFQFNVGQKWMPKVDPVTGIADYKELMHVEQAKENDVLCRITKPTAGKDGIDVFGNVIEGKAGVKARVDAGKDTKVVEDGAETLIVACAEGEILFRNDKVSINKVMVVNDVDGTTGNLNFIGSIYVKGNVHSGFKVKASGNIIVDGVVEDAKLSSSNDIVVRGGIKGSGLSEIEARGEVSALFIEHANVFAKKNIYADYVLNSNIESEQKIKLSGKYGFIIGGKAKAVEILASEVGNSAYNLTKLEVNYPKELVKDITDTKKEWKECKKAVEEQERKVKLKDAEKLEEAKVSLFQTRMAEKRLETKLIQLEGRLAEIKKSATIGIYIEKQLYPNVTILMENRNYHNKELKQKCSVRKIEGKWKIKY
ncbi:FapA family protein [Clostridium sp. MD294]|uniref:DUF342 domain-containing protein n=1 Tax=Clostridium sp. MD294 TaxID=97138 RepID=UPI0003A02286|nr:FapA family protein [Clostridium sp. MD294]NDO45587.1 DUF342 domain-containing protein [Clostridium sp. MD294]